MLTVRTEHASVRAVDREIYAIPAIWPRKSYAEHGAEEPGSGSAFGAFHVVVEASSTLNELAIRGKARSTLSHTCCKFRGRTHTCTRLVPSCPPPPDLYDCLCACIAHACTTDL